MTQWNDRTLALLHFMHCVILHFKHYTLQITHCIFQIESYTLHHTHCILHIASYILHLTNCILHIAICILGIEPYMVPLTHCINLLNLCFRNLWKIYLRNLSNINWKIYQNNKRNLSNTEISQLQRTHYKSPCNWIKSSVSSMTSAEEGQPPSNEPEEWQDTHPLSPQRWGTTLLTSWGPLHFPYMAYNVVEYDMHFFIFIALLCFFCET